MKLQFKIIGSVIIISLTGLLVFLASVLDNISQNRNAHYQTTT